MQNKFKKLCIILFFLNVIGILFIAFIFNGRFIYPLFLSYIRHSNINMFGAQKAKYCLADENDKCVTRKIYDYIRKTNVPNLYIVRQKKKVGVINSDGKTVYPIKYDGIDVHGDTIVLHSGNNFKIYKLNKQHKRKLLLSVNSDSYPRMIASNIFEIRKNDKNIIINEKGKPLIKGNYQELFVNNDYKLTFRIKKDDKWGIVNIDNEYIIPCEYDELKWNGSDFYAKKNGKWGKISNKNDVIIDFIYDELPYIFGDDYLIIPKYIDKKIENNSEKNNPKKITRNTDKVKKIVKIKNKVYGDLHVVSVYDDGDNVKRTFNHQLNKVNVMVEVTDKPVTILLSSYEPVEWTVRAKDASKIKKIYFTGYHDGSVIPPNKNIPVEKLSGNIDFDEDNQEEIEKYFDKKPATFQYKYGNDYFFIDGKTTNRK